MRTTRVCLLLSLLLLLIPAVGSAQQRAMTVDDAMDMVAVSGALMSPDGESVFFSRRTLDWEKNKYEATYHLVSADGGDAYRFLGEDGGSAFQYSPDGRYFSFRRAVEGTQQIFYMRTTGGEAVQLTEHKTSVAAFEWSPDGSRVFFTAEDARPDSVKKEIENGADAIFVDEGPNGKAMANWRNLWVFDLEKGEEAQVTQDSILISDIAVAPDGFTVAFIAQRSNRQNDSYLREIHVVDSRSPSPRRLTTNNAPESGLLWAPSGEEILYAAADDREWMNRNTKYWLLDAATGESRLLSGAFEGTPRNPAFTPDGRSLLFTGQQRTTTNLFRLDVASGTVEQLTDRTGTLTVASYSADRSRYVFTFSDFRTPPDLYVGGVGTTDVTRLTEANPQISDLQLAEMEVTQWQSFDGVTIEGLLHRPSGQRGAAPLMLHIHGGPAGVFANSWQPRYHIYAGLGYASLSPNVRGSSGYTDELREGNTVQEGDGILTGDYQDLQTGVDAMIDRGIADPDRVALRGWSYGGILGGWTITQSHRFKAASIGAGVYDWTSEYGPGFNHDVRLWHFGGTPWDNAEVWRGRSALTHVAEVRTPTLLLHGEEDPTDTEQQSMMFYTALRDIGRAPARYVKFPREPHGFREPRHQRVRDIEELRWMQKYVLGVEWTPWERPSKTEDRPVS